MPAHVRAFLFLACFSKGLRYMGTQVMESHNGAWWSYPVYAAGFFVGSLSPQDWLVSLSLVAVMVRIVSDIPTFFASGHKIARWVRDRFR